MKLKHLIFSLFIVTAFISCEVPVHEEYELDGTIQNNNNTNAIFKATIDGVLFEPENKSATIVGGVTNISGIASNGKVITMTLLVDTVGNYSLDYDASSTQNLYGLVYKTAEDATNAFVAGNIVENTTGFINITEIDTVNKLMSGTFEATTHDGVGETVTITNGEFSNLTYQTELVNNNNNEFFAKVGSEEFVEDSVQANKATVGGYTTISITATKNNLQTIGLTIPFDNSSPGTYNFSSMPSQGNFVGQYNLSMTEFYSSAVGNLTITAHDTTAKTMTGTFFFTAQPMTTTTPSFEITEGSFSVTYTE
jgi:hypothetical protein